jgi:methyltransferase
VSWRHSLLVLAAFGSQRVIELGYSAHNERRLRRTDPGAPEAARSVFKWIVLTNVSLFTLPLLETRLRGSRRVPMVVAGIGWVGAISAACLRLWVIATLRRWWTVRAVVPADLRVSAEGPYRWIRHPNYVALILEFAALPLVAGAYFCAVSLSAVNGALLWRRIAAEESLLERHPEYRRLMAHKPRFIPRFFLASGQKRQPVARR